MKSRNSIMALRCRLRQLRRSLGTGKSLSFVRGAMNLDLLALRTKEINDAIESGKIETASRDELAKFNAWLCHPDAGICFAKNYSQVSEAIRLHMLRSMIDAFEERSKAQYRWVLFFAFLAILATLMPYFIPPPSDTRTIQQPTAPTAVPSTSPLPRQESPAAAPRHDSPPSSRPAKTEIEKHEPAKP